MHDHGSAAPMDRHAIGGCQPGAAGMALRHCTASAPGKLIFFGEHAVVYGTTAVAASLSDLRIAVAVSPVASQDGALAAPGAGGGGSDGTSGSSAAEIGGAFVRVSSQDLVDPARAPFTVQFDAAPLVAAVSAGDATGE